MAKGKKVFAAKSEFNAIDELFPIKLRVYPTCKSNAYVFDLTVEQAEHAINSLLHAFFDATNESIPEKIISQDAVTFINSISHLKKIDQGDFRIKNTRNEIVSELIKGGFLKESIEIDDDYFNDSFFYAVSVTGAFSNG